MWSTIDETLMKFVSKKKVKYTKNLALFDLDQTLIQPKDERRFPDSADDWEWVLKKIPSKLKSLHKSNYTIIIISNQKGLNASKDKIKWFKEKIVNIANELNIPFELYAATSDDLYRKPNTKIIEIILDKYIVLHKLDKTLNLESIFFVGDAAGRSTDHSAGDLLFACNTTILLKYMYSKLLNSESIECEYFTPEQYFSGKDKNTVWKVHKLVGFDTLKYIQEIKEEYNVDDIKELNKIDVLKDFNKHKKAKKNEMILMFGFPGSGKSTYAKLISKKKKYVYTSQDQDKTRILRIVNDALDDGKNIVIDNTHVTKMQRKKYIDIAKKHKVPVRIFVMYSDNKDKELKLAKHLNDVRYRLGGKYINASTYGRMNKAYTYPTLSEGIQSIEIIPFIPMFKHKIELIRFLQYSLSK